MLAEFSQICNVHGIRERRNNVNMKVHDAKNLESSLASKLEEILGGIVWFSSIEVMVNPADYERDFDLLAGIALPRGNRIELWVECKDMPRPSRFPYVSLENRFRQDGSKTVKVPTLAAPYISPRMAEMCEKHGWSIRARRGEMPIFRRTNRPGFSEC